MIPGRRRRAPAAAALALAGWCLATLPLAAQQPPVPLFPPTMPEPAPPPPPSPREPAPDREAGRPAPPPEPAVQVERLAPPSVDAIGLPAPEGLGDDVWDGGDPRAALDLLERLPARTANPALRALTRRLLASGGPPVDGGGEEGRPLALRVERLLAMGELDAALALLGRLPAGQGGEALERLAAEALLLAGGTDDACARGGEGGARSFQGPFWSKLGALCRLRAGERAEARLAVELLREETGRGGGEADDPLLFALFDTIDAGAGGGSVEGLPPAAADGPSPLHLALLREARLPVPGEPLDRLAPGHLAAIARDSATPAARRVAAAERAAALGALPAGELAAVYGDADLGGPPAADPSALARLVGTPEGRARLFQALRADPAAMAPAWAETVGAVWRAVDDPRLRPLLARLFAGPLADSPPAAGAGSAGAVLGLLALGRPEAAAEWWRPAADPAPLGALFALARGEEPDAAALAAWRRAEPAGTGARLLALFQGMGTPAPEPAWRAVLDGAPPPAEEAPAPAAAETWLRLRHAAAAGRTGEAVLSGLVLLDGRPELAHPVALADALAGLRRVGLEREARAVALDAALTLGGRGVATGGGGGGDG